MDQELFDKVLARLNKEAEPKRTIGGTAKDVGISAAKGILGIPEMALGALKLSQIGSEGVEQAIGGSDNPLVQAAGRAAGSALNPLGGLWRLDKATGGHANRALNYASGKVAGWQEALEDKYSDAQKAANKRVEDAQGFWGTTGAMLQNPSTIAHMAIESLPTMWGGAKAGQFAVKGGLKALEKAGAKGASGMFKTLGEEAGKNAGKRVLSTEGAQRAAKWGGRLGEGLATTAGMAEQISQEQGGAPLTAGQGLASLGAGALTSGLSAFGGAVGKKFGAADIDELLAGGLGMMGKGGQRLAAKEAAKELAGNLTAKELQAGIKAEGKDFVEKHIARQLAESGDKLTAKQIAKGIAAGTFSEGVLEELPQSMQEQVWQNIATGKAWDEDVMKSGAQGMLTGGLMGAGANVWASTPGQQRRGREAHAAEAAQEAAQERKAELQEYAKWRLSPEGKATRAKLAKEQAGRHASAAERAELEAARRAEMAARQAAQEEAWRKTHKTSGPMETQLWMTPEDMPPEVREQYRQAEEKYQESKAAAGPELPSWHPQSRQNRERARATEQYREEQRQAAMAAENARREQEWIEDQERLKLAVLMTVRNEHRDKIAAQLDRLKEINAKRQAGQATPEEDAEAQRMRFALMLTLAGQKKSGNEEGVAAAQELMALQETPPAAPGSEMDGPTKAALALGLGLEAERQVRQTTPSARDEQSSMFNRTDEEMPPSYHDAVARAEERKAAQDAEQQAAAAEQQRAETTNMYQQLFGYQGTGQGLPVTPENSPIAAGQVTDEMIEAEARGDERAAAQAEADAAAAKEQAAAQERAATQQRLEDAFIQPVTTPRQQAVALEDEDIAAYERKQERQAREAERLKALSETIWEPHETPPELAERLAVLEAQMNAGERGQKFFTGGQGEETVVTGMKSTNPEWMRQPKTEQEKADPDRQLLYKTGKADIRTVLNKWREGKPLTENQREVWYALQRAAWRYGDDAPYLDQGYEDYRYAEKHGMALEQPYTVAAGSLQEGDTVLVRDREGGIDAASVSDDPSTRTITIKDGVVRRYSYGEPVQIEGHKPVEQPGATPDADAARGTALETQAQSGPIGKALSAGNILPGDQQAPGMGIGPLMQATGQEAPAPVVGAQAAPAAEEDAPDIFEEQKTYREQVREKRAQRKLAESKARRQKVAAAQEREARKQGGLGLLAFMKDGRKSAPQEAGEKPQQAEAPAKREEPKKGTGGKQSSIADFIKSHVVVSGMKPEQVANAIGNHMAEPQQEQKPKAESEAKPEPEKQAAGEKDYSKFTDSDWAKLKPANERERALRELHLYGKWRDAHGTAFTLSMGYGDNWVLTIDTADGQRWHDVGVNQKWSREQAIAAGLSLSVLEGNKPDVTGDAFADRLAQIGVAMDNADNVVELIPEGGKGYWIARNERGEGDLIADKAEAIKRAREKAVLSDNDNTVWGVSRKEAEQDKENAKRREHEISREDAAKYFDIAELDNPNVRIVPISALVKGNEPLDGWSVNNFNVMLDMAKEGDKLKPWRVRQKPDGTYSSVDNQTMFLLLKDRGARYALVEVMDDGQGQQAPPKQAAKPAPAKAEQAGGKAGSEVEAIQAKGQERIAEVEKEIAELETRTEQIKKQIAAAKTDRARKSAETRLKNVRGQITDAKRKVAEIKDETAVLVERSENPLSPAQRQFADTLREKSHATDAEGNEFEISGKAIIDAESYAQGYGVTMRNPKTGYYDGNVGGIGSVFHSKERAIQAAVERANFEAGTKPAEQAARQEPAPTAEQQAQTPPVVQGEPLPNTREEFIRRAERNLESGFTIGGFQFFLQSNGATEVFNRNTPDEPYVGKFYSTRKAAEAAADIAYGKAEQQAQTPAQEAAPANPERQAFIDKLRRTGPDRSRATGPDGATYNIDERGGRYTAFDGEGNVVGSFDTHEEAITALADKAFPATAETPAATAEPTVEAGQSTVPQSGDMHDDGSPARRPDESLDDFKARVKAWKEGGSKSKAQQEAESLSDDDIMALVGKVRDKVANEKSGKQDDAGEAKPRKPRKPSTGKKDTGKSAAKPRKAGTKKASEAAAESVVAAVKGMNEALEGLRKLFAGKGMMGSGLVFDEDTYREAKPHFIKAWEYAQQAKKSLAEFIEIVFEMFGGVQAEPYAVQFIKDIRDGKLEIEENDNGGEAATETKPQAAGKADDAGNVRPVGEPVAGHRPGALEAVPSQVVGGDGGGKPDSNGGRGGGKNPRRDSGTDESRVPVSRGGRNGEGAVHTGEAGAGRADGDGVTGRDPNQTSSPAAIPALNFRITDALELGKGGETQKYNDNVAAIRLLKKIQKENRRATPEEQAVLARYVGWGGLPNAFRNQRDKSVKSGWEKRVAELEELLTPEELKAARDTTTDAHYTSQDVVNAIWRGLKRLGFTGGNVLEPSVGSGNFLGLMPQELAGKTRFIGSELDGITAQIAKLLYPNELIYHTGFEKLPMLDNSMDAMVGNPPFGEQSIVFARQPWLNRHSIHNQFVLSSLASLRPGGVMGFVVSRYLMDNQDDAVRKLIAGQAKLLGAIRLPGTAFKENARTEVVTDIIFLQKNTEHEQMLWDTTEESKREFPDWVKTRNFDDGKPDLPVKHVNTYFLDNPNHIVGVMNREGSMRQANDVGVTFTGDMAAALNSKIDAILPQNVIKGFSVERSEKVREEMVQHLEHVFAGKSLGDISLRLVPGETDENGAPKRELVQVYGRESITGSGTVMTSRVLTKDTPWAASLIQTPDGRWYEIVDKLDDKGKPVKVKREDGTDTKRNVKETLWYDSEDDIPTSKRLGKKYDLLVAATEIIDLVRNQNSLEINDAPEKEIERNRALLNAAYEKFVQNYGYANNPRTRKLVGETPNGPWLLALEATYREKKKGVPESATKADILLKRVNYPVGKQSRAENMGDALSVSLSEMGRVDIDRMAELRDVGSDQVIKELCDDPEKPLIFYDPETHRWEKADEYLSGNVRRKLNAAIAAREEAAMTGATEQEQRRWERAIAALEAVQPEPWESSKITPTAGATWIPEDVYADFYNHLTGGSASVKFTALSNTFDIREGSKGGKEAAWQTADKTVAELFSYMLNSRTVKITRTDGDKKYVDTEASQECNDKIKEMREEFHEWVFSDTGRRERLTQVFNDKYNVRVLKQYDGSHLQLPGKVPDSIIKMRRHQLNAIWRGIVDRFVLYDHAVGAGKTFTGIARAMERRRMGLSRKPMIVVPNHLVRQFAKDVYTLYPAAKVLAATPDDMSAVNRRRLFGRIATGDWDIVIVPHSSFNFIGIDPILEASYIQEEIDIVTEALAEAEAEDEANGLFRPSQTVKDLTRLEKKLRARMEKLKARSDASKDKLLTFEQLGIDDLTIDEAHEFKNLFYTSNMQAHGMGNRAGSDRAYGVYTKVKSLRDSGGSTAFMTGTPISNSAVEMYTMMRYLAGDTLKEMGLEHFDAWRTQFVDASSAWEPTESGKGIKMVERLGREWSNMRSLMDMYYSFADCVSNEDIQQWYLEDNGKEFPLPRVKDGGRQMIEVKPTPTQLLVMQDIMDGFDTLPNIKDYKERNKERLRLMDRARKVSLDARAVDPELPGDEGGKLGMVTSKIYSFYRQYDKQKGTQLVFLDRSVPHSKGDEKIVAEYDDWVRKLTAAEEAAAEAEDGAALEAAEKAAQEAADHLEKFNPHEIEELRNALKGGWNAYQQIKDNLVALGIPAEEIRFVQEANTDKQKQDLFDDVKSGKVRVLIGSSQRMGAGTNVQDRLVALHHVDVTWKPSDIEQREGRIIRQGNMFATEGSELYDPNFEVTILAYGTERTIDAKMWNLNSTKLKMINGIRKYNGDFTMEFDDEESVSMAEMAAILSGDPLQTERVQLDSEIEKLSRNHKAFLRSKYQAEDRLAYTKRVLRDFPAQSEVLSKYAEISKKERAEERKWRRSLTITIDGETYTNEQRDEAWRYLSDKVNATNESQGAVPLAVDIDGTTYRNQDKIRAAFDRALGDDSPFVAEFEGKRWASQILLRRRIAEIVNEKAKGQDDEIDDVRIGMIKMGGLDFELSFSTSIETSARNGEPFKAIHFHFDQQTEKDNKAEREHRLVATADGAFMNSNQEGYGDLSLNSIQFMFRNVQEAIRLLPQRAEKQRDILENARKSLPTLEQEAVKEWPKQEEYDQKKARLAEVEAKLKAQADAAQHGSAAGAGIDIDGTVVPEAKLSMAAVPVGDRADIEAELASAIGKGRAKKILHARNGHICTVETQEEARRMVGANNETVKRSENGTIQGFYLNGVAYLVKDGIARGNVMGVLMHEYGEHAAQLGFADNVGYRAILASIKNRQNENSETGKAIRAAMERVPKGTKPEHYWNEVVAYLVEANANIKTTALDRITHFFRKWLHKITGLGADNFTHKDLVLFARAAVKAAGRGKSAAAANGKPADLVVRFSKQLGVSPEQLQKEYDAVVAKYKDTPEWRKAPNGKDSNLDERQWVLVRTPRFKKWFGDWEKHARTENPVGSLWGDDTVSKVVDDNGEPKVVYHGTKRSGFTVFDNAGRQQSDAPDGSNFFSDSFEVARGYSGTREDASYDPDYDDPGNYAVFLNIRNPNEAYFEGANWDGKAYGKAALYDADGEQIFPDDKRFFDSVAEAEQYAEEHDIEGYEIEEDPDTWETTNGVAREGQRMGYDGAIIHNVIDSGPESYGDAPESTVYITYDSNQIKSATDNSGAFDPNEDDILLSKAKEAEQQHYSKADATTRQVLPELLKLVEGQDGTIKNVRLGSILYPFGKPGTSGMGFLHIVERRIKEDAPNYSLERAVDIAVAVAASAKNGRVSTENVRAWGLEKNGVRAIISKTTDGQPIITGFAVDRAGNKKGAGETEGTVSQPPAYLSDPGELRSRAVAALKKRIRQLQKEFKAQDREAQQNNNGPLFSIAAPSSPAANPANNNAVTGQSFIDRILANAAPKWRDRWERFIYNFLDSNDPRERVWKRAGSPSDKDFVTIERLRGKKAAAEQKRFKREMLEPLLDTLGKAGLSVSDLEEYAHALHTPERNQRMREVNAKRTLDELIKNMPERDAQDIKDQIDFIREQGKANGWTESDIQKAYLDLMRDVFNNIPAREQAQRQAERALSPNSSQAQIDRVAKGAEQLAETKRIRDKWQEESVRFAGMTDADAASIIQKWQGDGRYAPLQKAQRQLAAINEATLDVLHEAGELGDEEYQAMKNGYSFYVPLHRDGFQDTRPPAVGRSTGPVGSPFKVAKGSMRQVVNILANSVQAHETAINRRHKLEAGRALYEFAQAHPDAGITVERQEKKPTHDKEGNIVMYTSQAEPEDGVFVKVDGVKYLLRFNTNTSTPEGRTLARFLDSVKGADAQLGGLVKMLHQATRWLAAVNTSFSPEFVVTNFSRDFQTAFIHLNQDGIDMDGLKRAVAKDVFPAMKGIFAAEHGKRGGAMAKWYEDYEANGGKVGWMQSYEGIEDLAKDIKREMKLHQKGHHAYKAWRGMKDLVEHANAAIENCMRLATYKALVERGVSRQKAAMEASSLTVDFTQRGKMSPQINALYMFFNASVQGTVRMVQALATSRKVQAIAGGIVGAGFVLQMLALAGGGDDDSGEPNIFGIPESTRERNIIIMLPGSDGKRYIKIPKAYGYGALYDFGAELANSIYMGSQGRKYDHAAGAMRVVSSFANSFNPIQSATLLQALSPTLLDPVVYAAENKTWAGTPLMPEQSPYGPSKPDSERAWKGTSPIFKKMAESWSGLFGGDSYSPGKLAAISDISPETLSMLWDTGTGGMGRFVGNVVSLPFSAMEGEVESRKVPFLRQVYGEWNDRAITSRYYEAMDRAEIAHMRFKNAESLAERKRLYQEPDHKLYLQSRLAEKQIKALRKRQQLMEAAGDKDGAERLRQRIVEKQAEVLKRAA